MKQPWHVQNKHIQNLARTTIKYVPYHSYVVPNSVATPSEIWHSYTVQYVYPSFHVLGASFRLVTFASDTKRSPVL